MYPPFLYFPKYEADRYLCVIGLTNLPALIVSECTFPPRWEGTWFQSGVTHPIVISRNELSGKGRCLHSEGDKFLLVNQ